MICPALRRSLAIIRPGATSYQFTQHIRCLGNTPRANQEVVQSAIEPQDTHPKPYESLYHYGNTLSERVSFILRMKRMGGNHNILTLWEELSSQHGPIYRHSLSKNQTFVVVSSAEMLQDLFENLGHYPSRLSGPGNSWYTWRTMNNQPLGLLQLQGKEWAKHRSVFNQKMQVPRERQKWLSDVRDVNRQFISLLRNARDPETLSIPGLLDLFQRMALEVVCRVMMEGSVQALEVNPPAETMEFIEAVRDNLLLQNQMGSVQPFHIRFNTKYWRGFSDSNDVMFRITERLVERKLASLSSGIRTGGILEHFLQGQETLSRREVIGNLVDFLMAGSDTTANTLGFLTWHLAQNPGVQERLRDVVTAAFGQHDPDMDTLMKLQYPRWCMKEIMRLEPVVPFTIRSADHEMVIGGYSIPPNAEIALNLGHALNDPKHFENPREMIPGRWSRDQATKIHPFAAVPFLTGVRMCAGRRLAELEIISTMVHLVQNFRIEPIPGKSLEPFYRSVYTPGPEIPVKLREI